MTLLLAGAAALPLMPCAVKAEQAGCAGAADHRATPAARCHETQAPAAQMSCDCGAPERPVPPVTSDSRATADAPLTAAAAPGGVTLVRTAPHVVESTTVRIRTRPLFTLFSAFLI